MTGSNESRAALASTGDEGTIMAMTDLDKEKTGSEQVADASVQTQEMSESIAPDSQPIPGQQAFRDKLKDGQRTTQRVGIDKDLRQELDDMIQDVQEATKETRNLRTQLAPMLFIATRVAPTLPQQQDDRVQKFTNTLDCSGSNKSQLRGSITHLQKVIRYKPGNITHMHLHRGNALNWLSGVALRQILLDVQDNGDIGRKGLSALIQLLEADYGNQDPVATGERNMQDIKQNKCEFSQY
ncbi:hypothetical protein BDD12DRAFT_876111 [Trichophaea hybrida]|nr:hypothetical protein BDD12DRAFT_876111 [Trichophaea hybrida]